MKRIIAAILIGLLPALAGAAGVKVALDKAPINPLDQNSLRNGAQLFIQYCLSCHSAQHQRWSRMGKDLGIAETELQGMLVGTDKVGDPMRVALRTDDAKVWFGTKIPDLTLVARVRGTDWLYTYLRGFYQDEKRPFGVNNRVFADVGMPHVLAGLEGVKRPVYKDETGKDGKLHKVVSGYEYVVRGSLTGEQYDAAVRDLVNFMAYIAEPAKPARQRWGVWVIAFLVLFTGLAYLLKKEYWKDVH
jgi:ubiquinol-cytochrome c reductase cytochrome c1 subunit